jgi:hypothetical protein
MDDQGVVYLVAEVISYVRCLNLHSEAQVSGIDGTDRDSKGKENKRRNYLLLLYVSLEWDN